MTEHARNRRVAGPRRGRLRISHTYPKMLANTLRVAAYYTPAAGGPAAGFTANKATDGRYFILSTQGLGALLEINEYIDASKVFNAIVELEALAVADGCSPEPARPEWLL